MNLFHFCFISILFPSYITSFDFFNHWQCIGILNKIDFSKPYKINIGELPLVIWKDKINNQLISTINICKHMGSTLDQGKITDSGCLRCPYHGLEFGKKDSFGEVLEHEGKLFWAHEPFHKKPFNTPFFNNNAYETSLLEIDMPGSLTDSAYNTLDLRHPEFVHGSILGFGNNEPAKNIKHFVFNKNKDYKNDQRLGLSFDYTSNAAITALNKNVKETNNFHMYLYPSFSWSKVSFDKNNLIIGVNLLPLENKKTRWYVTIGHNYYQSPFGKKLMETLASIILKQDFEQMTKQADETELKKIMLFEHVFKDEEVIIKLKEMMQNYEYPSMEKCIQLYKKPRKL
jgi:phenylpropionate dioxygenase-like ring-hydroxylating dioxygenase large terminal subunit